MIHKFDLLRYLTVLFLVMYQQAGLSQTLMKLTPGQAPVVSLVQQAFSVPAGETLRLENLQINDNDPSVVDLELRRIEVTDAQTQVLIHSGGSGRIEQLAPRVHFAGKLAGDKSSFAFLSVDSDGGMRSIVHRGAQVYVNELQATNTGRSAALISRKVDRAADFVNREFICGVNPQFINKYRTSATDKLRKILTRTASNIEAFQSSELISQRRADIIVETDFELFVKLGSNSTTLTNYVTDLFAYLSARYQSEIGTRLLINQINVSSTPDTLWTQNSTSGLLSQLEAHWNSSTQAAISRHHVHLLSGKNIPGGVAYVGTLQSPKFAYGVSAGLEASFNPSNPQIVWDSVVVAHELGHAFGSFHTHAFDDPNSGSSAQGAIDCCYSDTATGQCGTQLGGAGRNGALPGLGSISGGTAGQGNGTIMSYCHLIQPTMSNLTFTFGTNHPYGVNPARVVTVMQAGASGLPLDTAATFALGVSKSGVGSGTVSSNPAGISCGATCSANFNTGSSVTLTAVASSGSTFSGWSGSCSGSANTCTVSVNADVNVTASFALAGGSGTITGTADNDTLTNGTGNNTVNGLGGVDTYVSSGPRSQYSLTVGTSSNTLTDTSGTEGIDTLSNVERLKFSDGVLALDVGFGQIGGQAYRIYKAAFNRTPDNGGLKFWMGRMDAGVNLADVAAGFIASPEFIALYGSNPSDGDFVTRVYSNVLGRTPDLGGFNYWVGRLSSGSSRPQVLAEFSESNENVTNVAATIGNGIFLPN